MKRCTKCGFEKDESEFHRYARSTKPRARCKVCINAANVAREQKDVARATARVQSWREKNPGRASAISRAWQLRNPEKYRAIAYRRKFNIEFDVLWGIQEGKCASCHGLMLREGMDPLSVCVDHDRSCCAGQRSCGRCVRGLIHRNCNLVLGYAKDNVDTLRHAILYLEGWRSRLFVNGPSLAVPITNGSE